MARYLEFVEETVDTLRQHQAHRLADGPKGELSFTLTGPVFRTYHSVGERRGKSFKIYTFPGCNPEHSPAGMDLTMWPVLEQLAELTGNAVYSDHLQAMKEIFVDYGFDPRSGLPYWGAECDLDVVRLGPAPNRGCSVPRFKFGGNLPYESMWKASPEKLARALKASYYGLVTRLVTMDFNRFCYYGFDDGAHKPSLEYDPGQVAFAGAAMWIVEGWTFHACKTGDKEMLGHARAMADKWEAFQHPETGMLPHFLAAKKEGETTQTVQPYANPQDSHIAVDLLKTATRLEEDGGDQEFAEQLRNMAVRLMTGFARYAYDPDQGIFHNWLHVSSGDVHKEAYVYHFHSQEQKDHWVAIDPMLVDVAVCPGSKLYGATVTSFNCADPVIGSLASVVESTSDPDLLQMLKDYVALVLARRKEFEGPVNEDGAWTASASASYIKALLVLARETGEERYVEDAKLLADLEIDGLASFEADVERQGTTDWWRMPFRSGFLASLLELEGEMGTRLSVPQDRADHL